MNEQPRLWFIAYCNVLAIRLHPRNDGESVEEDLEEAQLYARAAAEQAVNNFIERFGPVDQVQNTSRT